MRTAVAGLAAALFVCASFAQQDAVVITATRFQDSKRDLPVGVTLISADDLQKSATSNLPEILAQFGLMHVRDNGGTPNQQLDLRGFGITGDQNTLVLVDGLRISESELVPAQLAAIPLESIERIEIVRGSGAVLYGGGATGGTINIITRRPEPGSSRGYALGRFGGFGTKEGRAGYSRMGEALGLSLDLSHEDTDGYRRNNNYRQTTLSALLETRPAPQGRAYLRLALGDQSLELAGALTEAQIAADRRQASTPGNESDRQDATVTLGGSWRAGRHELAADLSHRDKKASSVFVPTDFTDTRVNLTSFVPRAKLRFGAHDLTLGFDWEQWDYENDSSFFGFASRRTGKQENMGFYLQPNFWIAERTRLVLGGRVQRSKEQLDNVRAAHTLEAYEAAVRQGFAAGWSLYGKYGSSFRLANFDENACFVPPCATTLLEPQTARAGEIGVEYERGGWRTRAAVYDKRLEDEIYFSPLLVANVNLPPTRRRGLELEASWRATPVLELRGGLALLEAEFRATGNEVPLVPGAIATAGLAWSFAPRSRLNVNARHVGSQRYDGDEANASRKQPAYGIVDAKLEHRAGRAALALELRNLLDEKYYSYGLLNFTGTSFFAYPAPQRAAYLSLAYRID
ncbi:MAG TPA: TonB-dependent receptor [Burkholderiales bacterium]|nr:TonB-dependent receptor [Burkholderiales bacterium]